MSESNYRVFLELGDALPADRLCRLLEAIDRLGSINRAAADLQVSYRYAWGLLRKAEAKLACPLLQRRIGGAEGGGAELSAAARRLLVQHWQFQAEAEARLSEIFRSSPADAPSPQPDTPPPQPDQAPLHPEAARPVLLASTIGPVETGLVPALEQAFYQQSGIQVRHVAAGSGQALDIAREGRADLVLAHAPEQESVFLAAGWGTGRYPLMVNDFLLLGPEADPAGVRGADTARVAFARLAAAGAPFVSRGDRSGTHTRELALWAAAGMTPAAPWYRVCDQGAMGSLATLRAVEASQAYTLVDRAAFLAARGQGLQLVPLLSGDPELRNEFALLPVQPDRWSGVPVREVGQFVQWATGPQGQRLIRAFGADRYGEPLFLPVHPPGD